MGGNLFFLPLECHGALLGTFSKQTVYLMENVYP